MIKRACAWFDRQSDFFQIIVFLILIFLVRTFGFGLYQVPTGSMETTMLVGERFFADKLTVHFTPIKKGDIISFNSPNFDYSDNCVIKLWQKYIWGPDNWTKRVIGVPGDHVQGKIENGAPVVYVNGVKLDEPYVNKYPLIAVWTNNSNIQSKKLFKRSSLMYFSFDPQKKFDDQPFYTINPVDIAQHNLIPQILEPNKPMKNQSGNDEFDVKLEDEEYWVMGDNRLGSYDSRSWGVLNAEHIHGRIKFCIFSVDTLKSWWIIYVLRHPLEFWSKIRWSRCCRFVR